MAFLILGILLLAMKLAEFGPVAAWSWWLVLAPFGLAVLWWGFSDAIGLTQRRAMDKMEQTQGRSPQPQPRGTGAGHAPRPQGSACEPVRRSGRRKARRTRPGSAAADEVGRR